MNIQFFGNSILRRNVPPLNSKTFCDLLVEKYQLQCSQEANDYVRGLAQCSEERILYHLKKTPKIDVAIIFHAYPFSVFMPCLDQDFPKSKIADEDLEYMKKIDRHFNKLSDISKLPKIESDTDYSKLTHISYNEVIKILDYNQKNFYNQDIQLNRYYGALIQIDQYLTHKKIKAIHCVRPRFIPDWFKFSSGIVDDTAALFQYTQPYGCSYSKSSNAITSKGNKILAKRFIRYIDHLMNEK